MSIDTWRPPGEITPVQQAAIRSRRLLDQAAGARLTLWALIDEAYDAGESVRELSAQSGFSTQAIYQHLSERHRT